MQPSLLQQMDVSLIQVAATELIAGVSGESEERIRELFEQAAAVAPCVLFIDEIDAISSNRQNAQKDMERRIVSQLLASLDGLAKHPHGDQVLIIGATNRADTLDPALRRVGRFDQEISLGIPDRRSREHILRVICADLRLKQPFDYDWIAALTPGYVGADLLALATRAASIAVKRAFGTKVDVDLQFMRAEQRPPPLMQTVSLLGADDEVIADESPVAAAATAAAVVDDVDPKATDDVVMETVELDATVTTDDAAAPNAAKQPEAPVAAETAGADAAVAEPVNGEAAPVAAAVPAPTDVAESMETDDEPSAVVVDAAAAVEEAVAVIPIEETATTADEAKADTDTTTGEVVDEATKDETTVETKTPETATTPMETVDTNPETATPDAEPDAAPDTSPAATRATSPDAASVAVLVDDDEIVDLSDDETYGEAPHCDPNVKLALSLDEMIGWLSTEEPILSGDEMRDLRITRRRPSARASSRCRT